MSTDKRPPIDDTHEPEIDAPTHRSENVVGVEQNEHLIVVHKRNEDAWLMTPVGSPFAIVNVADHR